MKLSNAIVVFLSLGSSSARPMEKKNTMMTTRRLRTQTVYKSSSTNNNNVRLPSQLPEGYRALQGLFGSPDGGVPDGIPQSMITSLSLDITFAQPGDLGPAIPMPISSSSTEEEGVQLGSDYCTWEPEYDCYFAGWPMCCEFQNCPEEQPSCEIEPTSGSELECPNSFDIDAWKTMELNADAGVRFQYAVVLSESASPEDSIFCGRLESDEDGWVGWGISPAGTMEGGEGVIGTPNDGIVQKYTLGNSPRVEPMPQKQQTLMSTSLTQVNGVTIMEFTKFLAEEGEHTINPTGENVFLYAVGMSNDLGYHGTRRGSFVVTMGTDEEDSTSVPVVLEEEEYDPFSGLGASMSMSMPTEAGDTEEATQSIYEIIASGNTDFGTLTAAIDAAGLTDALSGDDGTLTVFAPPNSAFDALPPELITKLLNPLWQPQLQDVLLYHVLGSEVRSTDLVEGMSATTLNGEDIVINLDPPRVNTNSSILVPLVDIEASNGVIHAVDAVLTPTSVTSNIVDILAGNPDLSTLVGAASAADLVEDLTGDGPFTIFAPTNEAFAALPKDTLDSLLLPENAEQLQNILKYHVVGLNDPSSVLATGDLFTLTGDTIEVMVGPLGGIMLNNDATVTKADNIASNGIVHVIDKVLIPPADEEPVTMDMCSFCPDGVTADPTFVVDPNTGATCQQISDYAPSLDASDPICLQMSMGSFMCCPEAALDPCSFCANGIPNEDLEIPDEDGGSTSCGMASVFASTLESTMDMCAEMKMGEIICCPEDDGEFGEGPDFGLSMPDDTTPPATIDTPVPTPSPVTDFKPGWWRPTTGEPTAPIPEEGEPAGEPAGSTDNDSSGSAAMTMTTTIFLASIATVVGLVSV